MFCGLTVASSWQVAREQQGHQPSSQGKEQRGMEVARSAQVAILTPHCSARPQFRISPLPSIIFTISCGKRVLRRRKRQPTPVFLPGESCGQRSLVGCCPWGRTESDTTEATQQQQRLLLRQVKLIQAVSTEKLAL